MSYILYAEDDPDDQQALKEILKEIDPYIRVVVVPTGLALIQYLETLGQLEEWPCFIVLDMNMPVWDGIRTLKALKETKQYSHIPVIVFSTSSLPGDSSLSLKEGAVKFITKPTRQADYEEVMRQFTSICKEFV
jgi:CheY-like chemotaxis protein